MTSHATLIRASGDGLLGTIDVLLEAVRVQWSPPPRPSRVGGIHPVTGESGAEPGEKAKHTISNPTLDIVADERRLAVRMAVIEAEGYLARMAREGAARTRNLQAAVDAWTGQPPE